MDGGALPLVQERRETGAIAGFHQVLQGEQAAIRSLHILRKVIEIGPDENDAGVRRSGQKPETNQPACMQAYALGCD